MAFIASFPGWLGCIEVNEYTGTGYNCAASSKQEKIKRKERILRIFL
jgi:hypothetical protein